MFLVLVLRKCQENERSVFDTCDVGNRVGKFFVVCVIYCKIARIHQFVSVINNSPVCACTDG